MRRFCAWMLFTFAAVNIIATAILYADGRFCLSADSFKLLLFSLALWGWSRLK